MQHYGDVVFGVTHGLVHPVVGIATLRALHLQMDCSAVGDHIRAVGAAAELLAAPGRAADGGHPRLAGLQLTAFALAATVHSDAPRPE